MKLQTTGDTSTWNETDACRKLNCISLLFVWGVSLFYKCGTEQKSTVTQLHYFCIQIYKYKITFMLRCTII